MLSVIHWPMAIFEMQLANAGHKCVRLCMHVCVSQTEMSFICMYAARCSGYFVAKANDFRLPTNYQLRLHMQNATYFTHIVLHCIVLYFQHHSLSQCLGVCVCMYIYIQLRAQLHCYSATVVRERTRDSAPKSVWL